MRPFEYHRPSALPEAARLAGAGSRYIAGGTALLDLMKCHVEQPERLIDLNRIGLQNIDETAKGGLRLGALARLEDVLQSAAVAARCPVLVEALRETASVQLRHMGSVAGNLLQRTRCPCFRDPAFACNKRAPGSGCAAIGGDSRRHAILGVSPHCIAVHPSDPAVALAACDATVDLFGGDGEALLPLGELYRTPGDMPQRETGLAADEIITGVIVPPLPAGARSAYVKARERAAFDFALASAAVVLDLADGAVASVRIALGGVASVPWRAQAAETALTGQPLNRETIAEAATRALDGAEPTAANAYKIGLARAVVTRALERAGGLA